MTRRFIVRARAERDIQKAFEWYESEQPGLGGEFLASLRECLETIRNSPEVCAVVYGQVRRGWFPELLPVVLSWRRHCYQCRGITVQAGHVQMAGSASSIRERAVTAVNRCARPRKGVFTIR